MNRGTRLSGCAVVSMLFVIAACESYDSHGSEKTPENLSMAVSVSGDSGVAGVYCFTPVNVKITFSDPDYVSYIDSIKIIPSNKLNDTVYTVDLTRLACSISYADTGTHSGLVRIYETRNRGASYDSSFTVKIELGFSANAVNAELSDSGSLVPLKALGSIGDSVEWYWDLSKISDLGVIRIGKRDTSVFINREVDDTIFLSQTLGSRRTVSVAVPFKTSFPIDTIPIDTIHYNSIVPFTLSALNNTSGLNAYCFFPVTFTANPRQEDRSRIDSILLYTDELLVSPYRLNAQNKYTAVFDYADTGSHSVLMRVYNTNDDVPYRDTATIVRIGMNFGAEPMNYEVSDTGGVVNLTAIGNKASGVAWVWDLSKIGIVAPLERDSNITPVTVRKANYRETVDLYQLKRDTVDGVVSERKSPRKTFEFKTDTAFYRVRVLFPNDETHDFNWYRSNLPAVQNFREEAIKSGTSVTLNYYNKDEYAMSYNEYNLDTYDENYGVPSLVKFDSIYIGKNKVSAASVYESGTLYLGQVREDIDVRCYSRSLLHMRLLFPRMTYWDDYIRSDFSGIAIYILNKDVRSGRIIYKGNVNSQYNAEFVDTFQLNGKLLKAGGHEVYYDTRQYGEKFVGTSEIYGYKMIRFEFVDSSGVLSTYDYGDINRPYDGYYGFRIGWASRPSAGGQGYSWQMSDTSYMGMWRGLMVSQWDGIFSSMNPYNYETGESYYNLLDLFPDWTRYYNMPGGGSDSNWDVFWAGRLAYWTY